MSTHHVPNPSPYNGSAKFRCFVGASFWQGPVCPRSLCPDGCPNPCSTALAFLNLYIIICRGQVLVERPTATHFVVERRCGFQCFCTKPRGNIGGTKPLELLVRKKPNRNANFFMLLGQNCVPPALRGIFGKKRAVHVL